MATYKIVSHGGNGLPLNVETTSTISGRRTIEAMASKFVLTRFGATALPSKISVVLAPPLAEP